MPIRGSLSGLSDTVLNIAAPYELLRITCIVLLTPVQENWVRPVDPRGSFVGPVPLPPHTGDGQKKKGPCEEDASPRAASSELSCHLVRFWFKSYEARREHQPPEMNREPAMGVLNRGPSWRPARHLVERLTAIVQMPL